MGKIEGASDEAPYNFFRKIILYDSGSPMPPSPGEKRRRERHMNDTIPGLNLETGKKKRNARGEGKQYTQWRSMNIDLET
jgi:hypothetical protein